jgi:hypothetical protein
MADLIPNNTLFKILLIFDLLIELIIIFFFDHNKNFFFNIEKDKFLFLIKYFIIKLPCVKTI